MGHIHTLEEYDRFYAGPVALDFTGLGPNTNFTLSDKQMLGVTTILMRCSECTAFIDKIEIYGKSVED